AKIAVISWDKENRTRNWIVDVKSRDVTEVKLPKYKFRDKEHAMGIRDWSPDGKTFAATGDGLHLVKADGTHIKRLFDAGQAHLGHCRFSPDGRKILFIASEKDAGDLSVRTIDVATGKVHTIATGKNFYRLDAVWSPDGRRVAYCVTLKDDDKTGQTE